MDGDRFVEIDLFLGELIVVNDHRQVVAFVFYIRLAQRDGEWTNPMELLGFCEVKLVIAALAALFENHQLFMRLGNGTVEFIASGVDVSLQVGPLLLHLILRILQLFLLFDELCLKLRVSFIGGDLSLGRRVFYR